MPYMSLDNPKSLTEVVYDVRSPCCSVPRHYRERSGWGLLWGFRPPNEPSLVEASQSDRTGRCILFSLHTHFGRLDLCRGLWQHCEVRSSRAFRFTASRRGAINERFDSLSAS